MRTESARLAHSYTKKQAPEALRRRGGPDHDPTRSGGRQWLHQGCGISLPLYFLRVAISHREA